MSSSQRIEKPALNTQSLDPDIHIRLRWTRVAGHGSTLVSGSQECIPPVLDVVDKQSFDRIVREAKDAAKYGQVSDLRTEVILQQDVIDMYEQTLRRIGTPEALAALELARDPKAIRERRFGGNS